MGRANNLDGTEMNSRGMHPTAGFYSLIREPPDWIRQGIVHARSTQKRKKRGLI
jgi:hypothetical protein